MLHGSVPCYFSAFSSKNIYMIFYPHIEKEHSIILQEYTVLNYWT